MTMTEIVGSDLDGVIAIPTQERKRPNVGLVYSSSVKGIVPRNTSVIISSRAEFYRKMTERWLKVNGIEYTFLVLYNKRIWGKKTRENIIRYKYHNIKKHGCTVYYEDDYKICEALTPLLIDKCEIVYMGDLHQLR